MQDIIDKTNIIILSVSAGTGHTRAAEALREAFEENNSGVEVAIIDTFNYCNPFLHKLIFGSYEKMLALGPALYGILYSRMEKEGPGSRWGKSFFYWLLTFFSAVRLLELINTLNPPAIICTHPFPLGVLANLKKRGLLNCLTAGIVTDLDIHPFWVFPETDLYMVAAEELAVQLADCGIPQERIFTTGIPISSEFCAHLEKEVILKSYNLECDLTTILIMGGGLGMGPLEACAKALGSVDKRCQLLVVAGKNTRLKKRIEKVSAEVPNTVRVLGYVENVHQLMAASDIIVTKAGGLSCAEAMASKLPMFLTDSLPGHEQSNKKFLISSGAAVDTAGVDDLVKKIVLHMEDPAKLKRMSDNAATRGRSNAASESVKLLKERLGLKLQVSILGR